MTERFGHPRAPEDRDRCFVTLAEQRIASVEPVSAPGPDLIDRVVAGAASWVDALRAVAPLRTGLPDREGVGER
jgi:hypothetical protein